MPYGASSQMSAWAIGLDMAYATVGMLLVGAGIDWLAGTRPWFMLGLGLLGLFVGMYRFIRDAMRMNRESSGRFSGRGQNPAGQEKAGGDGSPEG
jgi:F0F1-type ATP synthase assembly protein I